MGIPKAMAIKGEGKLLGLFDCLELQVSPCEREFAQAGKKEKENEGER